MIDFEDFINWSAESDCCGAPILSGGICSDCHEHCEEAAINDEPDYDAITAREEQARNLTIYLTLK